MSKDNVILIGMPGCGKSTIGVVLAKAMGYDFVDSDIVIQNVKNATLEQLIDRHGTDGFNQIENEVNSSLDIHKTVLATGGSVIYGKEAMEHLKEIGTVVFINLACEEIESRLGDFKERGISIKEGQTLLDLFNERKPLYEKYADVIVDTTGLEIKDAMTKIKATVEKEKK